MPEKIHAGEVRVGGKDVFEDLTAVRTAARLALYGKTENIGVTVEVISSNGEVDEWEFDHTVGYPLNIQRNWVSEWVEANT